MRNVRRVLVLLLCIVMTTGTAALLASPAEAKKPHTVKKVIRPVHRNGTPVRGWSVTYDTDYGFSDDGEYYGLDCSGQAFDSVSGNVYSCGITADSFYACWPSQNYTVLCLQNIEHKRLVRVDYYGGTPRTRPLRHVSPVALKLARHGHCTVRLGGAWDRAKGHPDWAGYYSCLRGRAYSAVYGPMSRRDGIIRSRAVWRVDLQTYRSGYKLGPIRRDSVRTAYYLGTAR